MEEDGEERGLRRRDLCDISLVYGEETYLVGDAEANSAGLCTGSRCGFLRTYHEMSISWDFDGLISGLSLLCQHDSDILTLFQKIISYQG
jgi:hypothetical protein